MTVFLRVWCILHGIQSVGRVKEFGIDDSTSYCQLVTDKGYLPLKAGDVVWKRSEVGHTDDGLVDSETADYIVKGVADEGLTTDLFLLRKNIK